MIDPPDQSLFNAVGGALTATLGYVLKGVRDKSDKQDTRVDLIEKDVNQVKVLVAGEYVRREEFNHSVNELRKEINGNFQQVFTELRNRP